MYDNDPVKTRIFNSYRNIRQSCYNPNNKIYRIYNRIGIELECEFTSFDQFYTWVMKKLGPPPNDDARLIRKNMYKGYIRTNLEWGTVLDQQNRQRTCKEIKYKGKKLTASQWSRELGISIHTLYPRIRRGIKNPKELFYQGHRNGAKKR